MQDTINKQKIVNGDGHELQKLWRKNKRKPFN